MFMKNFKLKFEQNWPKPLLITNGHLSDDNQFNELQSQLTSIETARAANAARLACWFFQHFL